MNFCERSANLFMETADMMAKMSRETLVRATLPNFHLPAAVEILTTGSYSKVPRSEIKIYNGSKFQSFNCLEIIKSFKKITIMNEVCEIFLSLT